MLIFWICFITYIKSGNYIFLKKFQINSFCQKTFTLTQQTVSYSVILIYIHPFFSLALNFIQCNKTVIRMFSHSAFKIYYRRKESSCFRFGSKNKRKHPTVISSLHKKRRIKSHTRNIKTLRGKNKIRCRAYLTSLKLLWIKMTTKFKDDWCAIISIYNTKYFRVS